MYLSNALQVSFPVIKNHVLIAMFMMDMLLHITENRTMSDHWLHFEHTHRGKLGN